MGEPVTLTISTGRTGTVFLGNTFKENFGEAAGVYHESLPAGVAKPAIYHRAFSRELQDRMLGEERIERQVQQWLTEAEKRPVLEFGWTALAIVPALYSLIGERLRVLVLHRHPVSAAASHAIRGHYTENRSPAWAISPMHERVRFTGYRDRWDSMSAFEKSLYRWMEVTAYGFEIAEVYPELKILAAPCDKLFSQPELLAEIASFAGLPTNGPVSPSTRRNTSTTRDREMRPVGREWDRYRHYPELLELGQRHGYDMSLETVQGIVSQYQMPGGVMPALRRLTFYWPLRFRVGALLRTLRLRPRTGQT